MTQNPNQSKDPLTCGVKKQLVFRGVCFICLRDCDEDQRKACIQEMVSQMDESEMSQDSEGS